MVLYFCSIYFSRAFAILLGPTSESFSSDLRRNPRFTASALGFKFNIFPLASIRILKIGLKDERDVENVSEIIKVESSSA